jgi:hypothetical protein
MKSTGPSIIALAVVDERLEKLLGCSLSVVSKIRFTPIQGIPIASLLILQAVPSEEHSRHIKSAMFASSIQCELSGAAHSFASFRGKLNHALEKGQRS